MKSTLSILLLGLTGLIASQPANACTGITLKSKDGTTIVARTIEWGGSDLKSQYVIVPRGYAAQSYTPEGVNGMKFTARYGYVGLAVEQKEFIADLPDCSTFLLTENMRIITQRKKTIPFPTCNWFRGSWVTAPRWMR